MPMNVLTEIEVCVCVCVLPTLPSYCSLVWCPVDQPLLCQLVEAQITVTPPACT